MYLNLTAIKGIKAITSPPQSHLGLACHYPHIRECTLPLCVLAVACTMCNEALRKHCA